MNLIALKSPYPRPTLKSATKLNLKSEVMHLSGREYGTRHNNFKKSRDNLNQNLRIHKTKYKSPYLTDTNSTHICKLRRFLYI